MHLIWLACLSTDAYICSFPTFERFRPGVLALLLSGCGRPLDVHLLRRKRLPLTDRGTDLVVCQEGAVR